MKAAEEQIKLLTLKMMKTWTE